MLRQQLKLTQNDFVSTLGIKRNTLSTIESGKNKPTFDLLKKLNHYFSVNINHLISDEPFDPQKVTSADTLNENAKKPANFKTKQELRTGWNVIKLRKKILREYGDIGAFYDALYFVEQYFEDIKTFISTYIDPFYEKSDTLITEAIKKNQENEELYRKVYSILKPLTKYTNTFETLSDYLFEIRSDLERYDSKKTMFYPGEILDHISKKNNKKNS